ncbi:MAG: TonB-dependent receptor [Tepidisphaeraceae bacterium]
MTVALLILAAVAATSSPPTTQPETDDDVEERRAPVTEIVVTGQRLDAARARIEPSLGASTYTLTNDAIENRPGGETRDLGSILVQVPGVRRDGNGTLVVRSAPGGVQYRLNNIILPGGVADFGETLSARLADRTELITGALPAQYGLSSGGVVNVTTKNGLYAGGGGQAELYGGSHRMIEPAFEWAGARGGTSLFTSGSYRRSDVGIASPDGRSNPVHDQSREIEGFAFGDHVIDEESRVSLIFGTSNERNQIPALAVPAGAEAEHRHGDQSIANHYAIISYQKSRERWTLQASLFGLSSRETIAPDEAPSLQIDGVSRSRKESRQSVGTQIEGAYDVGTAHTLRAGFVASIDHGRHNERLATPELIDQSRSTSRRTTTSAFLQDEWKLSPRLTANAGLRADRVSDESKTVHLGPRASLTWVLPSGFSAHAGYARYYVAPPLGDEVQPSDGRLRGERDDYFDVGAEQKLGDLKIGVDVYRRSARNLLAERRWAFAPVGDVFNYRRARLSGIELLMTYADGPVTAWSNLAVSSAQARGIASGQSLFTPEQIVYAAGHDLRFDQDQQLTGSAGMSYRFGHLLLSGDMLYGSGTRRTAFGGRPNGALLPAYATVDLAAVYHLTPSENHPLDLRLDINNLFDRSYQLSDGTGLVGGAPQWGSRRGVFVGIEQGF